MNVFDKAIEVLNDLGWVRGYLRNAEGVCLLGSINIAGTGHYQGRKTLSAKNVGEHNELWEIMTRVLPSMPSYRGSGRPGSCSPVMWNDAYALDKADVIEFLRRCSTAYNKLHPEAQEPDVQEVLDLAQAVLVQAQLVSV